MRADRTIATRTEIMVATASRLIQDGQTVFIGTGLPMIAAYLAKTTHAPRAILIFESGVIDAQPKHLASGVGDFRLMSHSAWHSGLYYALGLLQGGFIDIGFLGGAEIDQYGNLNSTVIGPYRHPTVRLPGSGGANDIGSLAKKTVIMMPHEKRRMVARVQYNTTPGYLEGGDSRQRAGLSQGGPDCVITSLAVLGFDPESRAMQLDSVHPGVSLEEVTTNTGFDLRIDEPVCQTELPDPLHIRLLREKIDPEGKYIRR